MKTRTLLIAIAFLFIGSTSQAQFFKKLGKAAENAAERAVIKKSEQKVTKETEKAMDTVLGNGNKKEKRKKKRTSKKNRNEEASENENQENNTVESDTPETQTESKSPQLKLWSKYNFVPGDKIIFEDDLAHEENGEFPSRWDLISGSAENAILNETHIINLQKGTIITPLMDKESYLPEVFTIEFDAYFYSEKGHGSSWQSYDIRFSPTAKKVYHPQGSEDYFYPISLRRDGASLAGEIKGIKKDFKGSEKELDEQPVWRHFAITFNKRSLKVFVDQHRVLNIPNLGKGFKPHQFSIHAYSYYEDGYVRAIKNIRVAEGGKKLYDRVLADGKFVTRGILFDINKANIKPNSMGVISEIATMMKEHSDLKFSIEGHTDSDGEEAHNLKLSEARATAVKEALRSNGVDSARLQVKGLGESVPVSDNKSPEGKANNRRVEFIKI